MKSSRFPSFLWDSLYDSNSFSLEGALEPLSNLVVSIVVTRLGWVANLF